jgi:hypothetical protein
LKIAIPSQPWQRVYIAQPRIYFPRFPRRATCTDANAEMKPLIDRELPGRFDVRINFSKYETQVGQRSDVNVIYLDQARIQALYNVHRKVTTDKAKASLRAPRPLSFRS